MSARNDKPAYHVPSMKKVRSLPRCGFTVVSTFSGCGGSCLGFEMAGFEVLWANEFVPAAREVYLLNHPKVIVCEKDIRDVTPEGVLSDVGRKRGEIDVLEGSPPCASFSMAGKREKGWGQVRHYSDTEQRVDDLFGQFVRLLDGIQPRVFVAENVSGLAKGVAKGVFLETLAALKGCGYRVGCRLLDAQWLGVPQQRQRLFFVGVRNDLETDPQFPSPLPYRYSMRDAIPWMDSPSGKQAKIYGGHGMPFDSKKQSFSHNKPCPTILGSASHQFAVEEETSIARYAIAKEWDKTNEGSQSQKYLNLSKPSRSKPCATVTALGGLSGVASVVHPTERRKFSIAELKRICSFPDDFVLTGVFAKQWERLGRAVPPLMMRAVAETIRDRILKPCATK
jgi:DNA (cytosine-5)-methyltransferase 1